MEKCIIKGDLQRRAMHTGHTKVKVMAENYLEVVLIARVTGKTLQDVVDELLSFAISHIQIEDGEGNIVDINLPKVKEK